MANPNDAFFERLAEAFQIEAAEHVAALSTGLIDLEKAGAEPQPILVEQVYREVHSLKGAARAVNRTDIESVCQPMEDVLAVWKRDRIKPRPETFDALLRASDVIGALLAHPGAQGSSGGALVGDIVQLLRGTTAPAVPAEPEPPPAPVYSGPRRRATDLVDAIATPPPSTPLAPDTPTRRSTDAPAAREAKAAAAADTASRGRAAVAAQPPAPAAAAASPEPHQPKSPDAALSQVTPTEISGEQGGPPSVPGPEPVVATPVPGDSGKTVLTETIRVATSKLDALLLQSEEMLALKQSSGQRAADIRDVIGAFGAWEKELTKLQPQLRQMRNARRRANDTFVVGRDVLDYFEWHYSLLKSLEGRLQTLAKRAAQDHRQLGGMVDNLLDDAKRLLMMPFATLLVLFPKLVRDLARDQAKEIELVLEGGDVEIDKRILEEMKDPLIHIVRNCIDHGIESPAERSAAGKPATATVRIEVAQRGGSEVEILIADDGRGIDAAKVRASAVRHAHLTTEEAATLTDQEAIYLIFQSEVSTSPIITELSGRGLGMAIVREKVDKLGGRVTVETILGRGTVFRILLPLTLATFRAILVEAGGQTFAIPTAQVERVMRVHEEEIKTMENRANVLLDGRPVALVALHTILGLPAGPPNDSIFRRVVVLEQGDRCISFEVDAIEDEIELLVKSLGSILVRVRNVAGATVLGSGQIVPILNPGDLVKSAVRAPSAAGPWSEPGEEVRRRTVLVAEDSITSRMLLKNILEAAGYIVRTAVDGMDALTAFKSEDFDIVISDVDMPRMNGFDLTANIRHDNRRPDVPVVLVTSREAREDRERGIDVGANAYVVKSSFDQGNLLEVMRRLA